MEVATTPPADMVRQIHMSQAGDMTKELEIHTPTSLPLHNHHTEGDSNKGATATATAKVKRQEAVAMVSSMRICILPWINKYLVGGNDVEMRPMNGQGGQYGAPAARDPNAILNECRDIDRGIDNIEKNLERLRFLQQRAIDDPDASQGTATNRELDSLSSDTMTLYRSFAARIKNIKQQKESGDPRNKPQVGLVDRKLKTAINEYQQVDRDFRHKLSAQMERQYRIVRPDASDQEVQEAIQDTSNNQVFSQAVGTSLFYLRPCLHIPQLLSQNRRGQSQSALRAVQGRHEAIQKIERQMIELAQLFQDMEAAVVQQEPAIEHIDNKAEDTVVHLDKGNEQLNSAVDKARSARRKKWICLGIVGECIPTT